PESDVHGEPRRRSGPYRRAVRAAGPASRAPTAHLTGERNPGYVSIAPDVPPSGRRAPAPTATHRREVIRMSQTRRSGRAVHAIPLLVITLILAGGHATAQTVPSGEAVIAWHVVIAPTWLDPSTAPAQITPFGILYAIHDGLVRPLPGQKMGNSLA